jgi:hypothetical protein
MALYKCSICGQEFFTADYLVTHMATAHPSPRGISNRTASTLERWSRAWSERLGNWFAGLLGKGATWFLDGIEPEAVENINDVLKQIKDMPQTPAPVRKLVDRIQTPGSPIPLLIVIPLAIIVLMPMVFSLFQPLGNLFRYLQERLFHTYRFDADTVTRIWLRDKAKYEGWWDDVKDLGWGDDKVEVAKELAKIIPPLADMVRFADYSAFDPEVIARWQEFYDAPNWIREPMSLLGVEGEWPNRYWFSHWVQPGRFELGELHRRDLISDDDVKLAYRTMGYSPFWQEYLLKLVRAVPTRVDVRRWWDMRTIDEARLREIYHAQGYYDKDLDDYVLWTKVYVAFPDLMARWKNGWITLDDVKTELTTIGMPADRVEELIQTKLKAAQPERTAKERDFTKTDIYKGIKAGRITRDEGVELLMDLGFDEDEAILLLDVNVPEDTTDKAVKERELTKADILKGLKTEVITMDEARAKLLDLRYSPSDVDFLLKIYEAQVKPPVDPRLKEASKADIVLGVKKGLITQEEGYGMLLDIGFSPEAAGFILMVKTEESPFSPINYTEFKNLTQKYRLA